MGWVALVIAVIAIVVAYVMAPKPQSVTPAGLSEFQLPTAEVGREIPVLFGTRIIEGPNVVWYGHLKSIAVKK